MKVKKTSKHLAAETSKHLAAALAKTLAKTSRSRKDQDRLANLASALAAPQGKSKRVIGVKCPVKTVPGKATECGEIFFCKKKGDIGSYNIAGYENHLRTDHGIFLPKPIPVEGF